MINVDLYVSVVRLNALKSTEILLTVRQPKWKAKKRLRKQKALGKEYFNSLQKTLLIQRNWNNWVCIRWLWHSSPGKTFSLDEKNEANFLHQQIKGSNLYFQSNRQQWGIERSIEKSTFAWIHSCCWLFGERSQSDAICDVGTIIHWICWRVFKDCWTTRADQKLIPLKEQNISEFLNWKMINKLKYDKNYQ